jgi:DNA-binding transcriptional regulator YiaG
MTPAQFKEARHKLGLSQDKLASLWGMGAHGGRTIRRWEDGERPMNPVAAYCIGLMVSQHEGKDR